MRCGWFKCSTQTQRRRSFVAAEANDCVLFADDGALDDDDDRWFLVVLCGQPWTCVYIERGREERRVDI